MDTNRDSAHQSQNEGNFAIFSLGLEFLNEAQKEKNNGKETRHQRRHDSLVVLYSIYAIAKWESNVSSARLISFLNCPIDLIALKVSGREFHSKAPL